MIDSTHRSLPPAEFAATLRDSRFVICPRGIGVSSWRLFEAMKAGRCPVILSDQWVPPVGPDWPKCSVRISESEAGELPARLAALAPQAAALGKAAHAEWLRWFSRDAAFGTVVGWCLELRSRGARPLSALGIVPQLLRPTVARHHVLYRLRKALR